MKKCTSILLFVGALGFGCRTANDTQDGGSQLRSDGTALRVGPCDTVHLLTIDEGGQSKCVVADDLQAGFYKTETCNIGLGNAIWSVKSRENLSEYVFSPALSKYANDISINPNNINVGPGLRACNVPELQIAACPAECSSPYVPSPTIPDAPGYILKVEGKCLIVDKLVHASEALAPGVQGLESIKKQDCGDNPKMDGNLIWTITNTYHHHNTSTPIGFKHLESNTEIKVDYNTAKYIGYGVLEINQALGACCYKSEGNSCSNKVNSCK